MADLEQDVREVPFSLPISAFCTMKLKLAQENSFASCRRSTLGALDKACLPAVEMSGSKF